MYASPSATNVNSNGSYTYTASQTVNAAAAGAPAPFDVNRVTTYTVTQAPASGELLQSAIGDTYQNQTFSGATETISTPGSKTSTVGVDLDAGLRLGNGPYNETNTTTTSYTTPQIDGIYPLITGNTLTEPLARSVTSVTTDANAGGTYGGGGTTTTSFNNDGSFTRNVQNANGTMQSQTVNANGTAQLTTTPISGTTTQTSFGLPVGTSGSATIPVTVTSNGNTTNDTAVDWYPGGGQPPIPLALTTRVVAGPVALPSACGFVGTPPPVIEVNLTTTSLSPFGTYATSNEQLYNANGTNICHTQTATTMNYNGTTGALTSTTTTTIAEVLLSSNQTITGIKRI